VLADPGDRLLEDAHACERLAIAGTPEAHAGASTLEMRRGDLDDLARGRTERRQLGRRARVAAAQGDR
jgi:hypothetical protein